MKFTQPRSEQRENSNTFLTLKDGESINAVFRGEIYEFYTKWADGKSHLTSEEDPEGKLRFRVNAIVQDEGKFLAKIWEFGRPVYDQLAEINAEYALETIKVKVTRRGTKLDTVYMILPLLGDKDRLLGKTLETIEAIPLQMLQHKTPAAIKEQDMVNQFGF